MQFIYRVVTAVNYLFIMHFIFSSQWAIRTISLLKLYITFQIAG